MERVIEYEHNNGIKFVILVDKIKTRFRYYFQYQPINADKFYTFKEYISPHYLPSYIFKHLQKAVNSLEYLNIYHIK